MSDVWGVIPVAGRGTRFGELKRPKTLLQIGGRSIIDRLLERLAPLVTDVCLVVGEWGDEIRDAVGEERHGIRIHYVVQPQPLGVADAVCRARKLVAGAFLVVMGDVYYDEPLAPYVEIWQRSGSAGAVLIEPVSEDAHGTIGMVQVRDDRVLRIEKAPFGGHAHDRVSGLMILPESAFETCGYARSGKGEFELESVVAALIRSGVKFEAIRYSGWRRNINTAEDRRQVERRLEEAV